MINLLLVPVVAVNIVMAPCPNYPPVKDDRGVLMYYSCYEPATGTIYLARQDRHNPFARAHEMGHAYWYATTGDLSERSADEYADCATLAPWRKRKLCAALRRLAWRASEEAALRHSEAST